MTNDEIRNLKPMITHSKPRTLSATTALAQLPSFVIRHSSFVILCSLVIRHASFAQTPALVGEARQAIAENIPEVAIEKLRQAMESLPIGSEGRPAALALLAEAQLNTDRAADALESLSQITPGDDAQIVRLREIGRAHV